MCDVNDPRILNAYIAITEDEPTDCEFREHITNEILFGFVRVDDRFILITYVPDSVSGVRRARALVHSRSVAGILELSHAQFTASSLSDMSDANIRTRLKLGQNQVPNRPRPSSVSKRSSVITRRRKSNQYSPSPSPSPMSERNLRILTTEEPGSYEDDRMTATPTPSSPTSVASSFAESSISTLADHFDIDEKARDATEAMLQLQLAKKKELEEARFRQFQRDQQEERFKRDQAIKRFEEEKQQQKQQELQQQTPVRKELQSRKSFTLLPKPEERKSGIFPQVTLRKVTPGSNHPKTNQIQKDVRSVLNSYKKPELVKRQSTTEFKFDLKPVVVKPQVKQPVVKQEVKQQPVVKHELAPITEQEPVIAKEPIINTKLAVITEKAVTLEPEEIQPELKPVVVVEIKSEPIKELETEMKMAAEPEVKLKINQVLMAGFASVQTKTSPFWKRRYFIIRDDSLCFYKDEMAKIPISTINLLNVTRLEPANEDEDTYVPNSFVIDTQTGDSYQVFADQKKTVKQMYAILQSSI
ncbi:hypothetical protein HPULCUR_010733 [Helicostylum pulchrum]|uniref:PH domain-containing protein n=1 Tax=Helicostylum pulchrum TaxID=562976 RepID=A0ABP9YE48_9FUNG